MIFLGLTGSIGMGKSTAAERFKKHNIPVLDADKVVHDLYQAEAVPKIHEAFPGTVVDGAVDRALLSKYLMANPKEFPRLESIIHPMVQQKKVEFIADALKNGQKIVVLEIPLLLEGGQDKNVDAVIVVSADQELRRKRVMQRPGMTEEKLDAIIARQMPDEIKRKRADFIVDTSTEINDTWKQIDNIIAQAQKMQPTVLETWKKSYPDLIK